MRAAVPIVLLLGACSGPSAMPDAAPRVDAALPTELPLRLSETGLYTDLAAKLVDDRMTPYTPRYELWADGAAKQRWISLPPDAVIDKTDPDHWLFPIGTMWFKEFSRDGKRLETRLVWRVADTGDRERDTLFGAYVWNDDETEAMFAKAGALDIRGTAHDAPSADECWKCHIGEPGRALGYSAVQLDPYAAPNAALGYLHGNCGHCHNPDGSAWSSSSMVLRLAIADTDATTAAAATTTVGAPLQQWLGHGFTSRIAPGDPEASALLYRMAQRTIGTQMPPLATEMPDDAGIAVVRQWIEAL